MMETNLLPKPSIIPVQRFTRFEVKGFLKEKEYSLFALEAVDDHQRFVPTANNQVTISVENGEIVGLANGNPTNQDVYSLACVRLFQGKALAIVRTSEASVQIKVIIKK